MFTLLLKTSDVLPASACISKESTSGLGVNAYWIVANTMAKKAFSNPAKRKTSSPVEPVIIGTKSIVLAQKK